MDRQHLQRQISWSEIKEKNISAGGGGGGSQSEGGGCECDGGLHGNETPGFNLEADCLRARSPGARPD